jgi:hypothetical protein
MTVSVLMPSRSVIVHKDANRVYLEEGALIVVRENMHIITEENTRTVVMIYAPGQWCTARPEE